MIEITNKYNTTSKYHMRRKPELNGIKRIVESDK